jgi:hypothetical protein
MASSGIACFSFIHSFIHSSNRSFIYSSIQWCAGAEPERVIREIEEIIGLDCSNMHALIHSSIGAQALSRSV